MKLNIEYRGTIATTNESMLKSKYLLIEKKKRKGGKIDKQALENNENGVYKNKIYTFFSYREYFLQ